MQELVPWKQAERAPGSAIETKLKLAITTKGKKRSQKCKMAYQHLTNAESPPLQPYQWREVDQVERQTVESRVSTTKVRVLFEHLIMTDGGCLGPFQAGAAYPTRTPDSSARSSGTPWPAEGPWACLEAYSFQLACEDSVACRGGCLEVAGAAGQALRASRPGRGRRHRSRCQQWARVH